MILGYSTKIIAQISHAPSLLVHPPFRKSTGRFIPKIVSIEKGKKLKVDLINEIDKLVTKLDELTENELDKYIFPHPLLGKLTLREMLYFTIYHVRHHEELTKRNLNQ